MSPHNQVDSVSMPSNASRAGLAVVRRADGRTLRKSCHQQKLQCVGDKTSFTRCKRCQWAGLQCVYSARSSRRARQSNVDLNNWDTWDSLDNLNTWDPKDDSAGDFDSIFGIEPPQLDNVFPISPVSVAGTGESVPFIAQGFHALEQSSGTLMNTMNMSVQSTEILPEEGQTTTTEPRDTLVELAEAFNELEATFARTVEEQAGREAQDYPVGEVLTALEGFLGVLKLNNVMGASAVRRSQGQCEARLRVKQASTAAQGYVLCVRLLTSLSEQMLHTLLSLPLPSTSTNLINQTNFQYGSSPRASPREAEANSRATHVPQDLRLKDLHVSAKDFPNALDASINILRVGNCRLDEMEFLLGLDPGDTAQQEAVGNGSLRRRSLPARFVASIGEEEVSINSNCPRVFLQRYCAAIDGLAVH